MSSSMSSPPASDGVGSSAAPAKQRAGVVAFRPIAAAADGGEGFELLLVSRRSKQKSGGVTLSESAEIRCERFAIPAGKFEHSLDASSEECARREAREEAGIECECVEDLGWQNSRSKHGDLVVTQYFLAKCNEVHDNWEESGERERVWFPPEVALERVSYRQDLREVIAKGIEALRVQQSNGGILAACGATAVAPNGGYPAASLAPPAPVAGARASSPAPGSSREAFQLYSQQVGGHFCMVKPVPGCALEVEPPRGRAHISTGKSSAAAENYTVRGGKVVLKPFDEYEYRFYCQLPSRTLAPLLPFVPQFYGSKTLRREQLESLFNDEADRPRKTRNNLGNKQDVRDGWELKGSAQNNRKYIVLEDIGHGFQLPCFIDLKMGCRQRAARHSAKKRAHMAEKAVLSTSATLGFRICGMQCLDRATGSVRRFDKYWGQKVHGGGMAEALAMFFKPAPPTLESASASAAEREPLGDHWEQMLERCVELLKELELAIRRLPGRRLWSSSLLFGFDGAHARPGSQDDLLRSLRLKVIDFAHSESVGGDDCDEEYLCGIANLRVHLEALRHTSVVFAAGEGATDAAAEAQRWLEGKLTSPPPARMQDEEQERAWWSLHPDQAPPGVVLPRQRTNSRDLRDLRDLPDLSAGGVEDEAEEHPPDDDGGDPNSNACAQTVSGVTGSMLWRELAWHRMVGSPGSATPAEAPDFSQALIEEDTECSDQALLMHAKAKHGSRLAALFEA